MGDEMNLIWDVMFACEIMFEEFVPRLSIYSSLNTPVRAEELYSSGFM